MTLKPELSSDLRQMVRDVIREVIAQRQPASGAAVETVRIATDHDLAALVARITDPRTFERVCAGKLRFTLGNAPASASSPAALTGVITEQKISQLTGAATLLLAPGAVLTPLARDKARRLGLTIERRR